MLKHYTIPVAALALAALCGAGVVSVFLASPAEAAPVPVGVAVAVHEATASVAPSALQALEFTQSCGASAAQIDPGNGKAMYGFSCTNTSATMVAVGSATIGDPTSGRNSQVICDGCDEGTIWEPPVAVGYCRADTGTVTLYCTAFQQR